MSSEKSGDTSLYSSRSHRSVSVSEHTARFGGSDWKSSVRNSSRRPKSANYTKATKGGGTKGLKKPNIEIGMRGVNKSKGRTPRLYRSAPSLAPPESAPFTHNSLGSGIWCK